MGMTEAQRTMFSALCTAEGALRLLLDGDVGVVGVRAEEMLSRARVALLHISHAKSKGVEIEIDNRKLVAADAVVAMGRNTAP